MRTLATFAIGALFGSTIAQGPSPLSISVSPGAVGLRDVTQFTFTASGGRVPIPSYAWLFGDGSSGNGPTASRTYTNEGTFTITLRSVGAGETEEATSVIRVASLTGTWVQQTANFTFRLVMTQQGRALTGQWFVDGNPGFSSNVSPLSGTISGASIITVTQGGECLRSMTLTPNADITVLSGTVSSNAPDCTISNAAATFTRQ